MDHLEDDDLLHGPSVVFEPNGMVSLHDVMPTQLHSHALVEANPLDSLINPSAPTPDTLSQWQHMAPPPPWDLMPQPPFGTAHDALLPAASATLPPTGAYRASSWPALDVPSEHGLHTSPVPPLASVPPPPPLGSPCAFRHASLPHPTPSGVITTRPLSGYSLPTTSRSHIPDGVLASSDSSQPSFAPELEEDKSAGSGRSRRASMNKVPLANIAAIMTDINMGADVGGEATQEKQPTTMLVPGTSMTSSLLKGPLRDPPRSKSSSSRSARERMLQQNRMAQAKYRERQKERAVQMANELAERNAQVDTMRAALDARDCMIAQLQARISQLEAGGGVGVEGSGRGGVEQNGAPEEGDRQENCRLLEALRGVKTQLDEQRLWIGEGHPISHVDHPRVHPALCVSTEGSTTRRAAVPLGRSTSHGGVDVADPAVINSFGEMLQEAVSALLQHIHTQATQHTELLATNVTPTPADKAQALVHDWEQVLHQLQLSPTQQTCIINLAHNTMHRLQGVRVKRQQLCIELERVVTLGALGADGMANQEVSPAQHAHPGNALPTPQVICLHGIPMPLTSTSVALATPLLQALQATWQEYATLVQESNNLLLRHVLSAVQSARFLVLTYPDKCDAVQLGMMLAAVPHSQTGLPHSQTGVLHSQTGVLHSQTAIGELHGGRIQLQG